MRLNDSNKTPRKHYIYLDSSDLQGDIDSIIEELQKIKQEAEKRQIRHLSIELDLEEWYGQSRLQVYLYGEPTNG